MKRQGKSAAHTPGAIRAAKALMKAYRGELKAGGFGLHTTGDRISKPNEMARLIDMAAFIDRETAAPTMLEALEAMVKDVGTDSPWCDLCGGKDGHVHECSVIAAEAAIKLAKGESQ